MARCEGNKKRSESGERDGERILDGKGTRQGCPLKPTMFNFMLTDLEEVLKREGLGRLKEEKIYSLAYADDIILLAKEETDMRLVMDRLEIYLEEKGLQLNVEKSKILRFWKQGEKKSKMEIEEERGGRSQRVQVSEIHFSKK